MLRCGKSTLRCGVKHLSKSKCKKHTLLHVQPSLCVTHAMDSAPCQKRFKRVGSVAFSKTMASVGHLKTICTDACRMAGAVRETSSSEILGG